MPKINSVRLIKFVLPLPALSILGSDNLYLSVLCLYCLYYDQPFDGIQIFASSSYSL